MTIARKSGLFACHSVLDLAGSLRTTAGIPNELHQFAVGQRYLTPGSHFLMMRVVDKIIVELGKIQHTLQDGIPR